MKLVTSIVQRVFGAVLTSLIPRNFKRIMLLTTIYHRMVGDKGSELEALRRVDTALKLTRTQDPKSLVLITKLDDKIWGDLNCDLVNASRESLFKDVLRNTPCWLLYARRDDIVNDIRDLQRLVMRPAHTQA